MADFVAWVRGLGPQREFVASPLGFDGTWIDHYLRRFASAGVCPGIYDPDPLFHGAGLSRGYANLLVEVMRRSRDHAAAVEAPPA